MITRLNDTRFYEEMENSGYGYYSIYALRVILQLEDEINPDWELDPVTIAGTYTEYTPKDLINDFGYATEAGGYSYHQVEAMTDDELEEVVDEILENIQDRYTAVRIPQEQTILVWQ